uniref:Uncharacterized protein n=1 Tax=Molossus molossus TaxID=27622 RepID=A0A7J8K293_MOLMO|nr:hypothetical protein HJG59_017550 [Molossus molossus]
MAQNAMTKSLLKRPLETQMEKLKISDQLLLSRLEFTSNPVTRWDRNEHIGGSVSLATVSQWKYSMYT